MGRKKRKQDRRSIHHCLYERRIWTTTPMLKQMRDYFSYPIKDSVHKAYHEEFGGIPLPSEEEQLKLYVMFAKERNNLPDVKSVENMMIGLKWLSNASRELKLSEDFQKSILVEYMYFSARRKDL